MTPRAFDQTGGEDHRHHIGEPMWIFLTLEHIDQKLSADIDSGELDLGLLGDIRPGAVDPLEDFVRTTAPEGGADETAEAFVGVGFHERIVTAAVRQ